jgi:hypothetical protein
VVAVGGQKTVDARRDDLGRTAAGARDHRLAERHRLDHHHPERLVVRAVDEDVHGVHPLLGVRLLVDKAHASVLPEAGGLDLQLVGICGVEIVAAADQDHCRLGMAFQDTGHGIEQDVEALPSVEAAD